MTQKQNGVLEWLQSCETPAPSEPKIEAVIVAGKSYMNSSEFNKNSMVVLSHSKQHIQIVQL